MATYLIACTSITYAMKAQSILRSFGYPCEIQRTPKNLASGCGYSIRVQGELSKIVTILNSAMIEQKGYAEIGGAL